MAHNQSLSKHLLKQKPKQKVSWPKIIEVDYNINWSSYLNANLKGR